LNEVDGCKRHTDIQNFSKVAGKQLVHHHQKPLDLLEFFIKKSSEVGDVILDPYMGSASTAIAALNIERNFLGFELDEQMFKLGVNRVNKRKVEINGEM